MDVILRYIMLESPSLRGGSQPCMRSLNAASMRRSIWPPPELDVSAVDQDRFADAEMRVNNVFQVFEIRDGRILGLSALLLQCIMPTGELL